MWGVHNPSPLVDLCQVLSQTEKVQALGRTGEPRFNTALAQFMSKVAAHPAAVDGCLRAQNPNA